MIIWQVNYNPFDSNHKLFAIAASWDTRSKTKKSTGVISPSNVKLRKGGAYFFLELIK